jgi:hypothetical protein
LWAESAINHPGDVTGYFTRKDRGSSDALRFARCAHEL